jgi:hypothetical protein
VYLVARRLRADDPQDGPDVVTYWDGYGTPPGRARLASGVDAIRRAAHGRQPPIPDADSLNIEEVPSAVIPPGRNAEIVRRWNEGYTASEIAGMFSKSGRSGGYLTARTVQNIIGSLRSKYGSDVVLRAGARGKWSTQ